MNQSDVGMGKTIWRRGCMLIARLPSRLLRAVGIKPDANVADDVLVWLWLIVPTVFIGSFVKGPVVSLLLITTTYLHPRYIKWPKLKLKENNQ